MNPTPAIVSRSSLRPVLRKYDCILSQAGWEHYKHLTFTVDNFPIYVGMNVYICKSLGKKYVRAGVIAMTLEEIDCETNAAVITIRTEDGSEFQVSEKMCYMREPLNKEQIYDNTGRRS